MRTSSVWAPAALAAAVAASSVVPVAQAAPKTPKQVYAAVEEARKAGPAFAIQGEYEGAVAGAKGKIGVQVIALGGGAFQAVFLPGGLPGAGWDRKTRILCQGKLEGGKARFTAAEGRRRYLGGRPSEFSATGQFPPEGQKRYTAAIEGGKLTGKTEAGEAIQATKVVRKSPTLGAKPPAGAIVLLPFEPNTPPSLEAWSNPKWLARPDGAVQVVPRTGSNRTKRRFQGPWRMHLEFATPFQPAARGQGRGNSGVYAPGGREIQVLDSFGLDGKANECGGVYKSHPPRVNMCLPPLCWQTFDVTYHPAKVENGKMVEPAWYHVIHNGVVIHEKVPLGRGRDGGLNLQDHGNPVSYRNIWFVTGKDALSGN